MSRDKKKIRSVGGEKFVPVKAVKRDSADKTEYKVHKQKNLAKKKRQKSLQEKLAAEQLKTATRDEVASVKKSRPSRLKKPVDEVSQRSQEMLDQQESGDKEDQDA